MSYGNLRLWRHKALILQETVKGLRNYSSKSLLGVNLEKLRPLIMKRIAQAKDDDRLKATLPVAREVLLARNAREVLRAHNALYEGVSILIRHIPVWVCKYCPEVYIGVSGHLIQTCHGYRHRTNNKVHKWVKASINDVIVPVQVLHLQKIFPDHGRFDHQYIPAVVELCLQVGVDVNDRSTSSSLITPPFPDYGLNLIARQTMTAWEDLRSGVHKLLCAHPARVCKFCKEVQVGPSWRRARACGVLKDKSSHSWRRALVEDLVPSNVVWSRRRQDARVLIDQGRKYYGHAPAVVDLCSKAGALVPSKYLCMMKYNGFTAPPVNRLSTTVGRRRRYGG